MRIIAGSAKGSQIFAPKGQDTRPTQDRVRESLFNIMQGDIREARVLDLFAGSGALALESLSRGAREAVLVDFDREAMVCIQRNIAKLGFEDRARAIKADWQAAISGLARDGSGFDLVFLDPPYRMVDTLSIMERLAAGGLLAPGALMVVEHQKNAAPPENSRFVLRNRRSYGDTEITFLDYAKA